MKNNWMVLDDSELYLTKQELEISKKSEQTLYLNRSIRFKTEIYNRLLELSEKKNISFNKMANLCIEYALNNRNDEYE